MGPYQIGETLRLRCEAYGGRPLSRVTWWRDHALLDDSFAAEHSKVSNDLVVRDLRRSDLHTIFTCQAANNNISVPVSTSVKLDMQCEYYQASFCGYILEDGRLCARLKRREV